MNRTALFFLMLLLAGCSDARPTPTQAVNEMIESPLQNTVISSFDTYPPKPVVDADRNSNSSTRSPSECAVETLAQSVHAARGSVSGPDSLNAIP
jgi:PBP1b-binding outer membrane lipoprotein LpoB